MSEENYNGDSGDGFIKKEDVGTEATPIEE